LRTNTDAVALLLAVKLEDKLGSFVSAEANLIGADCGLVTRKTISYALDDFEKVKFGRFIEANETSEDTSLKLWAGMLRKCSPLAFYRSAQSLVEKISVSHSGHFIMTDNPAEFYKKLYCIREGEKHGCFQA
jgi:hypothetical protein